MLCDMCVGEKQLEQNEMIIYYLGLIVWSKIKIDWVVK
jgi:hypothetical protein